MTDTPLIRAARALMLSQSGVDDFDALDPEMQAGLLDDVRAVLELGFRAGYQAAVDEKVQNGYEASRHLPFEDLAWNRYVTLPE